MTTMFAPMPTPTAAVTGAQLPATNAERPLLRGRLHQLCAVASVPAGVHLVASAATTGGRIAAATFALTWTAMFTASSSYHCLARTERARLWLRRLDHTMIFVLIAGTYTPLCLLALPAFAGLPLLALAWLGAAGGAAVKLTRLGELNGAGAGTWLYWPLAWAAALALPLLVPALGAAGAAKLIGGGLLYTVGSAVLMRRRPDPAPAIFGYHEVWHVFTVAGGLCHFLLIADLVSTVA